MTTSKGFAHRLLPLVAAVTLSIGGAGAAHAACQFRSADDAIKHIVYIQFDNTHFTRDNPNVPSDLEQMPNLLSFMTDHGTLLTKHHTPLISHTATDILTSLTGVYGDRMGIPVSNSFRYFKPDGTTSLGVSFAYWTDPLFDPTTMTPTDTTPQMINEHGVTAPAPWVPFTRAGCDVGLVATANMVLENIATDIPTVFGADSPEAMEVHDNPAQATADFVGIAIHCALDSPLCATPNARPDRLPDEPGGYANFSGLFGHKYVAPQISTTLPLTDLDGNVIQDSSGHVGFPGFDGMEAAVSLAYVATMLEKGLPVVYAYISDAHDNHVTANAFGPGEAGYVAQLRAYDDAFGTFFERLAAAGIDRDNTLFVFTSDEGDHFAGGEPQPADCDGVTTPCSYAQIGEITADLSRLLATQQGNTTRFTVHSDDAPTVYITGNPAQDDPITRALERDFGLLTAVNPITGNQDNLMVAMADHAEMKLLHMVAADPARNPTFVMFGNPDYFMIASGQTTNCASPPPCAVENPAFAWNHGDIQPEITTTWLGMVGPGVRHQGIDDRVWSDHTDQRPTMLSLVGLRDSYTHDGRVLVEALREHAVPRALRREAGETFVRLARVYKQINAPLGKVGRASLETSTAALTGDDATYASLEAEIAGWTTRRDHLAAEINRLLDGAAFGHRPIPEEQAETLIERARRLIRDVQGGSDQASDD